MTQQEKIIASVFDKAIEALALMTNKISDSIKEPKSKNELLDHFAGLAIQGLISSLANPMGYDNTTIDGIAIESYEIADAMLKARKEVSND